MSRSLFVTRLFGTLWAANSLLLLFTFTWARMPRRGGGKRIRMDDPVPMEYEEEMYRGAG